ncbi:hypothetical protein QMZ05_12570 [Bradyrhizobium sp. INPA03-11B]|uniref:hypothetical protein n=1 Tax=Bradyrhizobium sp. INPA03-11B TaxID=418598 RepID=UPI00338EED43
MNIVETHNIAAVAVVATSVEPQSSTGGTINGTGIDRVVHNLAQSAILHQAVGAVSGGPSAVSVVTKIQDSADNSTFADYAPAPTNSVIAAAALTAQNTENAAAVDLSSARRYIRLVTTVTLTGGTSPAALVVGDLVLAGESQLPAA